MDKKLKTRLFGFSRKDTLNYIESYQAECYKKITELKAEVDALQKENDCLKAEKSAVQAEIDNMKAELDNLSAQLEEERKKTAENENVKTRVGEIFIDAKERADSIVNTAKTDAENIRSAAINQAKSTVTDIDATYSELETLRNNMKTVFNDFCDRVDSINGILKSAKSNLNMDNSSENKEVKIKYL